MYARGQPPSAGTAAACPAAARPADDAPGPVSRLKESATITERCSTRETPRPPGATPAPMDQRDRRSRVNQERQILTADGFRATVRRGLQAVQARREARTRWASRAGSCRT